MNEHGTNLATGSEQQQSRPDAYADRGFSSSHLRRIGPGYSTVDLDGVTIKKVDLQSTQAVFTAARVKSNTAVVKLLEYYKR